MRCLAIRHILCEDLGTLAPLLRERLGEPVYVDMRGKAAPPAELEALTDADLVVVLGGPMAVYEADDFPFLKRELELLRERLAHGRPTLGICLGAQLIAAAAGARVYLGGRQEIGWYPVRFGGEAAVDPTLGLLAAEGGVYFHWHGDTFDLPAGAVALGASERCAAQGFMLGRHAIALQFHAEVDAAALERWLLEYEAGLQPGGDVMDPAALRSGAALHGPALARRARDFLAAWLDEHFPPGAG